METPSLTLELISFTRALKPSLVEWKPDGKTEMRNVLMVLETFLSGMETRILFKIIIVKIIP